jgi:hypothetical protein
MSQISSSAATFVIHEAMALSWLATAVGRDIPSPDIYSALRDGVVLCDTLNKFRPNSVLSVHRGAFDAYRSARNVSQFIAGLKKADHESLQWFDIQDLLEKRNLPLVVLCILSMRLAFEQIPLPSSDRTVPAADAEGASVQMSAQALERAEYLLTAGSAAQSEALRSEEVCDVIVLV